MHGGVDLLVVGKTNGGHYTAYTRSAHVDRAWHCFNDHKVSKASFDSISLSEAYVLFYERRKARYLVSAT